MFCVSEYALAVKLGTITKDGKADVYSYDEDDMVEDPNLERHLAHFGINIFNMVKVSIYESMKVSRNGVIFPLPKIHHFNVNK